MPLCFQPFSFLESCMPAHWYEKCKNLLEDTLASKKTLVGSTAWGKDFQV